MNSSKVIQRSLPITTTYKIVGSYYKSIEDGGGCCENCSKIISNIAEIENAEGNKYSVGMDCAATLSGIKGEFDFEYTHKANFTTAKGARAGLLKAQKEGHKNLTFKTYDDENNFYKQIGSGSWEYEHKKGGRNWKQYPADVWGSYVLPMIKDIKF